MRSVPQPGMIGAPAAPQLDADGRLASDLPCRRCGYSLRGLAMNGGCPECATPVRRSIHGDLLEFSDPNWVLRLARGGSLLVASILMMLLGSVALALWPHVFSTGAMGIGVSLARLVQALGFWLVTEPDPGIAHREGPLAARTLARWSSIVAAGLSISARMAGARTSPSGLMNLLPAGASPIAGAAVHLLIAALSMLSIVALLRHARGLALRLPDERLARRCANLAIWLAVLLSARAIMGAAGIIAGKPPGNRMSAPASTLDAFANLATAFCMYLCIGLIFEFRSRMSRAAALSRESWARPID